MTPVVVIVNTTIDIGCWANDDVTTICVWCRVFAENEDREAFLDAMIRIAFTKCGSDCAETSEVLNVRIY